MTLEKLFADFIDKFPGINVFYDHIQVDDDDNEIAPPIVLIHETIGETFFADNRTYWIGIENRIDVLQVERDVEFRKQIMEFLNEKEIAFEVSFEDFDESIMLYQDSYVLTLDQDGDSDG